MLDAKSIKQFLLGSNNSNEGIKEEENRLHELIDDNLHQLLYIQSAVKEGIEKDYRITNGEQ